MASTTAYDDPSQPLRQRHPAAAAPTSSPANSDEFDDKAVDWDEEIQLARAAVAERMAQQQKDDGWALDEDEEEIVHNRTEGDDVEKRTSSSQGGSAVPAYQNVDGGNPRDAGVTEDKLDPALDAEHEAKAGDYDRAAPSFASPPGAAIPTPATAGNPADPIAAQVEDEDEDKTCRICFGGEDEESGRLFSPCLCRGTVSPSSLSSSVCVRHDLSL